MGEIFDSVLDVNAKTLHWNFKVYVIRIWEVPSKFNNNEVNSIEMVLQDNKGGRIHASIPRAVANRKWRGVIEAFQMYIMSNFVVLKNTTKTKTYPSQWLLMFSHRTRVNHVENPSFPLEAFHFKTIPDLVTAQKIDENDIVDLIAEVVGKADHRDLVTSKGMETKRLVLELKDLENNRIHCILFGEMVDQILPHLQHERVEPLIVVFQLFKAHRWNGQTSIQSNFNVSKLHINPELKEVVLFRDRLLSGASSNSVRISQMSSQGASSGIDELTVGSAIVKSIDEVLTSTEEGTVWIVGTIVSINAGKEDWFYKSCRKCPKKVETPIGNRYECTKCGHTHGCAALRYKVEIMVHDGTGSINLLLWDRETFQLCGKQAEKVKEEEVTSGDKYPATLDNMMDKRVFFKINVKAANINHYDQLFTIMKICDDYEIIEKNIPVIDTTNPANNVEDNGCSNSLDFSENVVNLNTDNDTQRTMDGMEECISNLKYKTPAKRACSEMKPASNGLNHIEKEGQLSTNKFSRKDSKKQKSLMNEVDN
ncbi:replication protein A 70 kDa DNA-binding subunit A-like [Arachis duranensis]|uniref:Replication protein A 70 kDa DNA-binding subunit A-like n=1 Tax=Arachis duranensis TaxID=130453 RepID=A0A9C6TBU1_ARADU|nr:replication protein A 70 kDa DNA-binding subunit A-like [Arachis duranensis]